MIDDEPEPDPFHAIVLDLAGSLESIAAETYRIRVALEVLAGDALDRQLEGPTSDHPAGAELRYLGRLGLDLDDLEGPRHDRDDPNRSNPRARPER